MKRASVFVALAAACACSNPEAARLRETTKATYDKTTGKLKELTYDANKNGRIDTWTEMDGSRPVRSRLDKNEDGKLDRWEYYDAQGALQKVGFSRNDDGKPDAWAFAASDGQVERIEISSTADELKIDRWEHYSAAGLTAVEEDTNADGKPDKRQTYEGGTLRTAAFDENGDGKPDRRLTYKDGALLRIESEPDASGAFTKRTDVR